MTDELLRLWRADAEHDRNRPGLNPDNAFTRIIALCDAYEALAAAARLHVCQHDECSLRRLLGEAS